jgi:preprotein translocase subunit SecY
MFKTLRNALKVKDIRVKLLYTFFALIVIRLGSQLPVPGVNREYFQLWLSNQFGDLGFLNTLTGGSFEQMSIFALNITPYITAQIIMQLLTIAIPALEEMQKDGEDGRKKIGEITRYLTIGLSIVESIAMAIGFGNTSGVLDGGLTFTNVAIITASFTAGSAYLMWLGERINDHGIGNGISIILLINIVADMPNSINSLVTKFVTGASSIAYSIVAAVAILVILVGLVVLIIVLSDAERRISVQYAQKVQGRRMVGGQSSFIPLKVNTAGVMPIIFAVSIMQFPIIVCSFFGLKPARAYFWPKVLYLLDQGTWFNVSSAGEFKYTLGVILYIAMLIFFAYFYTSITFNPNEIASNMKKQGGFIPGIRPGRPTTDYLTKVLNYVVFIGAACLTVIALIPLILSGVFNASVSFGATSIIIIVGVVLETVNQIESMMLVRHYKGFLNE